MSLFLFIIFVLIAALIVSVISPGFFNDINLGFYVFIIMLFSVSALIIMFRKRFELLNTLSIYIAAFLTIFLLSEGAIIYFSTDDIPSGNEEAIVVSGSGLFVESRLSDELINRLDLALEIHNKNPDLPIILSGGTDENRALPESVAMENYVRNKAKELGIETPEIITESDSSGIYENIKFSLESNNITSAYLIVSRHNVSRTKIIAHRISPTSTVLGSDLPMSKYVIYYIREFGYMVKTALCDGLI